MVGNGSATGVTRSSHETVGRRTGPSDWGSGGVGGSAFPFARTVFWEWDYIGGWTTPPTPPEIRVRGLLWKVTGARFWVCPAGRELRLAGAKTAPEGRNCKSENERYGNERNERNGSNEAGWVYTGWQPGTQNGNSGQEQ